jgi:hypothetical protein
MPDKAHTVYEVTLAATIEPNGLYFDTIPEAVACVKRALERGYGELHLERVAVDHFDHAEDPTLDDWPPQRRTRPRKAATHA